MLKFMDLQEPDCVEAIRIRNSLLITYVPVMYVCFLLSCPLLLSFLPVNNDDIGTFVLPSRCLLTIIARCSDCVI